MLAAPFRPSDNFMNFAAQLPFDSLQVIHSDYRDFLFISSSSAQIAG